MLNIDTLKYNYYNDIAKFVINLCEGSFIGGLSNFNNYSSKDYYKDSKWMYSIKENDIIFSVNSIIIPLTEYLTEYLSLNSINETSKLLYNKLKPLLKCLIYIQKTTIRPL